MFMLLSRYNRKDIDMKYKIKIFSQNKMKIIYIKDINNYFLLNNCGIQDGEYYIDQNGIKDLILKYNSEKFKKINNIIQKRKYLGKIDENKYQGYSERYIMCIHISRECNLDCKYCFAKKDYLPNKRIDIEMAKKAVDFFLYDFAKNANQYIIDLSGSGEPLLQFRFIQELEEYVNNKRDELGKDIMIMFCTNGTLLDREMADYFKEKSRIILGISIDGDKNANQNRIYKNKKDTYEDIINAIELLTPKKVGLAVTFTKYNENIDEIFEHLCNIDNCDCVSIQNVRDFSNGEFSYNQVNLDNVLRRYEILIEKILKEIEHGKFGYFEKIIKGSDMLGSYILKVFNKGRLNIFRCSAGKNRIAVDHKGKIYTCSVMNGNTDFCIGDIFNGINKYAIEKFTKTFISSEKCNKCWAAFICGGECNANSYYTHGKLYTPNEKLCIYRKGLICYAIYFWVYLESKYPQEYIIARKMVNRVENFIVQDKGVWAVFMLLKELGKQRHYEDLINCLSVGDQGINPNEIIRFLNENLDVKYNFYKIVDSTYIERINVPAIGIINRRRTLYYEYCLIVNIDFSNVKIMVMRKNAVLYVTKEDFIKKCNYVIMKINEG